MANKHDVQLRTQLLEKLFPTVETVDNLDSDNANRPLSARQGKVLKELIKSGGGGSGLSTEVVETLPNPGNAGILYLVPKSSYLKEKNKYDEYIWIESTSKYELLGSFSTDLDINEIKSILGETAQINVATLSNNGINNYVTTGTYRVYGERINAQDGLPILNAANGHTVEGILRVYDSSIAGSGENTDKVVTQILSMSNRTGGDGHIWVRTGQGSSKSNLTWSTWEKLQGIFEKNTITDISELDTFTTNGIYSCMYVGEEGSLGGYVSIYPGATLLIIVINGYMASSIGLTPKLTQSIILTQEGSNSNYILTRHATFTNNSWEFNDISDIILGSTYITNANIGCQGGDARINIGTFEDTKVNINDAFIGYTNPIEAGSNSVIIGSGVRIERGAEITNTYIKVGGIGIGTSVSTMGTPICYIGQNVNISSEVCLGYNASIADEIALYDVFNDKFYIESGNNNTCLTLTKDTKVNINADNISLGGGDKNIELKCNNICLGSSNVGKIYIGGDVSIEGKTNIREAVNIEAGVNIKEGVNIGTSVSIGESVNIGTRANIRESVHIEEGVNIGTSASIGENVNIGENVEIGTSVYIGESVNIGKSVYIGENVNIVESVEIVNNMIKLHSSSIGISVIEFTADSIIFNVNGKTATIQLT